MRINRINKTIFYFSWDSFPLFQILNDYLRTDGKKISNNGSNAKFLPFFNHLIPRVFQIT